MGTSILGPLLGQDTARSLDTGACPQWASQGPHGHVSSSGRTLCPRLELQKDPESTCHTRSGPRVKGDADPVLVTWVPSGAHGQVEVNDRFLRAASVSWPVRTSPRLYADAGEGWGRGRGMGLSGVPFLKSPLLRAVVISHCLERRMALRSLGPRG